MMKFYSVWVLETAVVAHYCIYLQKVIVIIILLRQGKIATQIPDSRTKKSQVDR